MKNFLSIVLLVGFIAVPLAADAGQVPKDILGDSVKAVKQPVQQKAPSRSRIIRSYDGRGENLKLQAVQPVVVDDRVVTVDISHGQEKALPQQLANKNMTLPQLFNFKEMYDPGSYSVLHSIRAKPIDGMTLMYLVHGVSVAVNDNALKESDCQALGLSSSCSDNIGMAVMGDINDDGEFDGAVTFGGIVDAEDITDEDSRMRFQGWYDLGRQILIQYQKGLQGALDAASVSPQMDKIICSAFDLQNNPVNVYERYTFTDPSTGAMMTMTVGTKGGCEISYVTIKRLFGDLPVTIYDGSLFMPSNINDIGKISSGSVVPVGPAQPLK